MKRFLSLICAVLFLSTCSFSQEFKYAWLTDIHLGAAGSENDLRNAVDDINANEVIEFVIITGNLTENGSNNQLDKAKEILDGLKVPYYLIPGPHETRWSESGCLEFSYLWNDENFSFDYKGTKHIGINSAICWQGGGGHISPENLVWLQQVLDSTDPSQEVYFYTYYPVDSTINNYGSLLNLLADKNIKAVFTGYTDVNANPPNTKKLISYNGIPSAVGRAVLSSKAPEPPKKRGIKKAEKSWGYTLVESRTDSLLFFEVDTDSIPEYWGGISKNDTLNIKTVDLPESEASDSITVRWRKSLNKSMYSSLIADEERIFSVTISGIIYCYDINGNLKWEYDTGQAILSKPVRDKDVLVVATIQGDLFAFNANNGNVIQVLSTGETLTSQLIKIEIEFNGYKTRGAVAGTANGKMLCYDMYSLELIWENNSAKGLINTEPLLINDRIIYGSWDNNLYCVDARSGLLNWKWNSGDSKAGFSYFSPAGCTPVADDKYVYITAPDKFVTAIDLLLGRTIWRKDSFNSRESIGISNDQKHIYIKSMNNIFYIVSASDGKLVKEMIAGYGLDTTPLPPLEWQGNIIFGAADGIIYMIDKEYNIESLLFTSTARVNSLEHIKDNLFAASNMDGEIFIFEINAL